MKQGKFSDALEQYDLAEQVAPNNGLITLGKAHAELGASSYRNAEAHIRQSFGAEPALMMGRYDLYGFLGKDRVQVVIKDLVELSKANPNEEMAPFLLGYILYNQSNPTTAALWLNEAERREGRPDPTVRQMREYWNLPAPATAPSAKPAEARPEANK
jgi:tetratricopeptide (TPR) repeat protein